LGKIIGEDYGGRGYRKIMVEGVMGRLCGAAPPPPGAEGPLRCNMM